MSIVRKKFAHMSPPSKPTNVSKIGYIEELLRKIAHEEVMSALSWTFTWKSRGLVRSTKNRDKKKGDQCGNTNTYR